MGEAQPNPTGTCQFVLYSDPSGGIFKSISFFPLYVGPNQFFQLSPLFAITRLIVNKNTKNRNTFILRFTCFVDFGKHRASNQLAHVD